MDDRIEDDKEHTAFKAWILVKYFTESSESVLDIDFAESTEYEELLDLWMSFEENLKIPLEVEVDDEIKSFDSYSDFASWIIEHNKKRLLYPKI